MALGWRWFSIVPPPPPEGDYETQNHIIKGGEKKMNSIILAAILSLSPGYNQVPEPGEVVAVHTATANASAEVMLKSVTSHTVYTNLTEDIVTHDTRYQVMYTYDSPMGVIADVTNYYGHIDYSGLLESAENVKVVGYYTFDWPITNTVIKAQVPVATYAVTNTIATVTSTNHFGQSAVSGVTLLGGGVIVDGAAEGDTVTVILK